MTGAGVAAAPRDPAAVLSVRDLVLDIVTAEASARVVDHVSFDVGRGEVFGVVGESGSGKSVTMLAIMGLLPPGRVRVAGGEVWLGGANLVDLGPEALRLIRGKSLAMIFQEPMTSLNPVLRVGDQIGEIIRIHDPRAAPAGIRDRVIDLLELVEIPDAGRRYRQYPHEFSGGMRQRAMIAMAVANEPAVLIADEPTTALDVTIQAQIMEVLAKVRARTGTAMVLVTHDLGLVAETADRVAVMYGGRIVECADVETIFAEPRHPYTVGLLRSLPRFDEQAQMLYSIPGQPPAAGAWPSGCVFHPRCGLGKGRPACRDQEPPSRCLSTTHRAACHFADEVPQWAGEADGKRDLASAGAG